MPRSIKRKSKNDDDFSFRNQAFKSNPNFEELEMSENYLGEVKDHESEASELSIDYRIV